MAKWKKVDMRMWDSVLDTHLMFVDKSSNKLSVVRKNDSYYIELGTSDCKLIELCKRLPGCEYYRSYNIGESGGVRLGYTKDKSAMTAFLKQIDIFNPLENAKAPVFEFCGLPAPVGEEKFVSDSDKIADLSEMLSDQKQINARLMDCINELRSEVAALKSKAAAAEEPESDNTRKRTPGGMW